MSKSEPSVPTYPDRASRPVSSMEVGSRHAAIGTLDEKMPLSDTLKMLFYPDRKEWIYLLLGVIIFYLFNKFLPGLNFEKSLFIFGLILFSVGGFFHGYSSIFVYVSQQERIMRELAENFVKGGPNIKATINFFTMSLGIIALMASRILIFF